VCISTNGLTAILHGKVYIGGAYAVAGLEQLTNYIVLPFTRKSTAAAELCELEVVLLLTEAENFELKSFSRRVYQLEIVILQTEVDFIDNLQQINLKLHCGEDRAGYFNTKFTPPFTVDKLVGNEITIDVSAQRAPEAKKFNIVALNKAKGAQIIQLLVLESESAEVVNLSINLVAHRLGELYTLIAALEDVLAVEVGVLVEHHLVHIKLIEVGIKQRYDTGREFHHRFYSFFLSFSINIISQFY
jgi:hypothetical protein